MKLARGVPDVVTFNTLLDACCRVGDTTKAARLFRDGHRGVHARHHFVQHTHQGILPCGRLQCCNGALHVDEEKRNCARRHCIQQFAGRLRAKSDMLSLCEELIQECLGSCGRSCGHAQCFMSDWRTAWASCVVGWLVVCRLFFRLLCL